MSWLIAANRINYSSSFSIFVVIAGILLIRGGVKTARVASWFFAFMLAGFVSMIFIQFIIEPIGLKVAQFKLNPIGVVSANLFTVVVLVLIYWMYRELATPQVMEARKELGISTAKPRAAIALGVSLAVGLGVILYMTNNGESAKLVKAKAHEVYGDGYHYHINAMDWSGSSVSAQLVAYNDMEVLDFSVHCTEQRLTSGCSLR